MTLKAFKKRRQKLQSSTWYGLPLVAVGGWFYPQLGYLLIGCMAGAAGIAAFRGRAWCDWMCPRGSFYDLFLDGVSRKNRVPSLFRAASTRVAMICILFTILGVQIYFAWPGVSGIGLAFVIVLSITTSLGIVLGMGIHPRTWCHICPMGTIAQWLSEGKQPLLIGGSCTSCKACDTVCPMQLAPSGDKGHGMLRDNDCIKCGTCVAACPKKALSFPGSHENL